MEPRNCPSLTCQSFRHNVRMVWWIPAESLFMEYSYVLTHIDFFSLYYIFSARV